MIHVQKKYWHGMCPKKHSISMIQINKKTQNVAHLPRYVSKQSVINQYTAIVFPYNIAWLLILYIFKCTYVWIHTFKSRSSK